MNLVGERIKERRKQIGLSVDELADKLGKNRATIYRYENGEIENLPINILEPIAKALYTTPSALMGWDETPNEKIQSVKIPVVGYIAAGEPIAAIENIIDYEEIPEGMIKNGEYFGLLIKGDSMNPRICEGDTVIVRKQSDVDSGSIAAVIINGDTGTCKKVVKSEKGLTLISFNPMYEPVFFTWEEVEIIPVTICGKVVRFVGRFE